MNRFPFEEGLQLDRDFLRILYPGLKAGAIGFHPLRGLVVFDTGTKEGQK